MNRIELNGLELEPDTNSIMTKAAMGVARNHAAQIETWLKTKIQPKPRWVPFWIWHRIVTRVIYIEQTEPRLHLIQPVDDKVETTTEMG